jgi:hypothetical protein
VVYLQLEIVSTSILKKGFLLLKSVSTRIVQALFETTKEIVSKAHLFFQPAQATKCSEEKFSLCLLDQFAGN